MATENGGCGHELRPGARFCTVCGRPARERLAAAFADEEPAPGQDVPLPLPGPGWPEQVERTSLVTTTDAPLRGSFDDTGPRPQSAWPVASLATRDAGPPGPPGQVGIGSAGRWYWSRSCSLPAGEPGQRCICIRRITPGPSLALIRRLGLPPRSHRPVGPLPRRQRDHRSSRRRRVSGLCWRRVSRTEARW